MNKILFLIFTFLSFFIYGDNFIKGADISWVPGQESRGIVFRDTLGRQRDILDILKNDYQMNTIRLRVFVNPSNDIGNGLCDIAATVKMAKRVKQAGMQLMLTLHYSDSWADPGKQNPPAAWKNFTAAQLETAVYNHTREVMTALSAEGIYPVLVQIGNETNDGMLWEIGRASKNMGNYARFITAGNNAVKEISPTTKTVVHLSNGFDENLYNWNIGGLVTNDAKFDVIGMSAYPEYRKNTTVDDWQDFNNDVFSNITTLISTYKKPIIIAETGMTYTAEEQCRKMIADMIKKLRSLKDNMGLGVLYWEPQAGPGYNNGYNKGAWGADGRPTKALTGFIESITSSIGNSSNKNEVSEQALKIRDNQGYTVITTPSVFRGSIIKIYSVRGEIVYKNVITQTLQCKLSKGIYIVKIESKTKNLSDKLTSWIYCK